MVRYDETDKQQITDLLMGRKVTKVGDDTLALDDGTTVVLAGHDGGCACDAGCYDLTELNGVDNIITRVEFDDQPGDDVSGVGHYRIFVYADNQRVNLATFEGTDGNGYYGTGYTIEVCESTPTAPKEHP